MPCQTSQAFWLQIRGMGVPCYSVVYHQPDESARARGQLCQGAGGSFICYDAGVMVGLGFVPVNMPPCLTAWKRIMPPW